MTESEFKQFVFDNNKTFNQLSSEAKDLESAIADDLTKLFGK